MGGYYKMSKNKNKINLVDIALFGSLGFLGYKFIMPKEENQEEMFLAGSSGSYDVPLEINGTGLTDQQESFISQALSGSYGQTEISTFSVNGTDSTFISTSKKNSKSLANQEGINSLGGSRTFVSFTDDSGSIVGGADFLNMQSTTAERAQANVLNPSNFVDINAQNRAKKKVSSSSSRSSSSSPSKKQNKAELDKKGDDRWASVRERYSK